MFAEHVIFVMCMASICNFHWGKTFMRVGLSTIYPSFHFDVWLQLNRICYIAEDNSGLVNANFIPCSLTNKRKKLANWSGNGWVQKVHTRISYLSLNRREAVKGKSLFEILQQALKCRK